MARYIDAHFAQLIADTELDSSGKEAVYWVLVHTPTADVQEVKHGRWISNDLGGYEWAYYCSECGWIDGYPFNDRHKYCPNCGAKMKGGEE